MNIWRSQHLHPRWNKLVQVLLQELARRLPNQHDGSFGKFREQVKEACLESLKHRFCQGERRSRPFVSKLPLPGEEAMEVESQQILRFRISNPLKHRGIGRHRSYVKSVSVESPNSGLGTLC
jgi:hypothetical protein